MLLNTFKCQLEYCRISEYRTLQLRTDNVVSYTEGVNVWNKLSTVIENAPSLATVKDLLKQSLETQSM